MDLDGSNVTTWHPGSDIEGITTAVPESIYVYLGIEDPDSIKEFNLTTGSLTGKSWDLTPWMTGPSNSGLEALTFVPNGRHPYPNSNSGGLFYAGLQADGKIYVFDVNLSVSGSVTHVATITPISNCADISDLDYNQETNKLYAIFDTSNKLVQMKPDGTVISQYTLKGNDQEGLAIITHLNSNSTNVVIAEDTGPEVWLYDEYL